MPLIALVLWPFHPLHLWRVGMNTHLVRLAVRSTCETLQVLLSPVVGQLVLVVGRNGEWERQYWEKIREMTVPVVAKHSPDEEICRPPSGTT